ncbi:receptor for retinol uptake STRA6 [Notechis scutatus]|uniref:Receptor for retinol uptake STRA6 n=1 Tax=Notechis scutatus TaxID=8663 RepID=A0A6J1VC61_9SAUR|nr:receptor for retinol uptake STRA6 [Notechis scutatus]
MSSQELLKDELELGGNLADEDNWYIYEPIGNSNDMASNIIPDCQLTVPFDLYHCSMAPISLVMLVILSLLVKRKKLYPDFWNGVPGLLSPMHFLEDTQNKGLAIAVFGILFSSLCVLLLDNDPLPFISNSSIQNREYWKVLALFYYPAFYYPLLACATVRHRIGYLLGCLLSWCHCVLYIWQKVECPQSSKIYRYYSLLSYLPIILCLAVLSLWYPVKLVESFKGDARMATEKLLCLLLLLLLLRLFLLFRTNLQCLYRGAVENVFYRPCKLQPSQQSLICWMQFTGFQISFACLALFIQHIVFFICIVCFTFLIIVPLQSGSNMFLFKIVLNLWPFWLTLLVSFIVQNLLVRYYFLERDHLPRELTNRRAFYIVTYMFFPINVLLGLMAGIWRLVISALYNIVHFCQLDGSLLSRGVEGFDPGHRTYCQYLKIEVSQSHPAMKAFCLLLLHWQSAQNMQTLQLRDTEEGIKLMKTTSSAPKAPKGQQNRVRWRLAYTLLNNPSLLPYRKGALVDATANGTKASLTKP